MRIRNKKDIEETILNSPYYISEPMNYKGKWREYFDNDCPIHAEFGSGRGRFIYEISNNNPYINYIGLEKYIKVFARAAKKFEDDCEHSNVCLLVDDILNTRDIFLDGELDRIYLNFLDPWPKNKHEKRRCTYKTYLDIYYSLLKDGGEIHFKTDNVGLFEYSITSIEESKFEIVYVTKDLHKDKTQTDNIMTEYEEKFSGLGQPINKLIAKKI